MEKEENRKETEKKVRDLTGNREEKIAPKGPTQGQSARPAMKRPPVRMADGESRGTENRAEERTGARRFDRGGKRNRTERKERAPEERSAEKAVTSDAAPQREAPREGAEKTERAAHPEHAHGAQGKRSRNERRQRGDRHRTDASHSDAQQNDAHAGGGQKARNKRPERNGQPAEQAERNDRNDRGDRGVANARRKRDAAAEPILNESARRNESGGAQQDVTFTDEELLADGLLFMLDEPEAEQTVSPADEPPKEPQEQFEVIGIRFRGGGKVYFFSPNGIAFAEGDHAVLETVRGMEYGEVAQGNRLVDASEVVQPLKPVLRKATEEDDAHYRSNLEREQNARPIFEEKVNKNHLDMQLVDVEYTFDNTKLCFYFTADGRVDFRELVKDLASVFRTRIELRQIGVRDEARLFGGLGVCGRPFCCKSFLSDFVQVSIRMAKDQNLSLASAKISGSCGRLMCCLRYEQDTYERENAQLPRPNSIVQTPKGRATVLESSFLTGTVKVLLAEENAVRVFPTAEVKLLEAPRGKNASARHEPDTASVAAESAEDALPPENA